MIQRLIVGLIPLYLELYDAIRADCESFNPYIASVRDGLEAQGVKTIVSSVCRTRAQINDALAMFAPDRKSVV